MRYLKPSNKGFSYAIYRRNHPFSYVPAISFRFFFFDYVIRVKDYAPQETAGLASAPLRLRILDTHDFIVIKNNRKEPRYADHSRCGNDQIEHRRT